MAKWPSLLSSQKAILGGNLNASQKFWWHWALVALEMQSCIGFFSLRSYLFIFRERNIDWLPIPNGDLAHNPGVYPKPTTFQFVG